MALIGAGSTWVFALGGCASYRAAPIVHDDVQRALTPPDEAALQVSAKALKHPVLPPITLDPSDGLSPDEAAVMAVLVNPRLRAARDARAVADAQIIAAGILPDPTLSLSADVPVGGATAGSSVGVTAGVDWDVSALVGRSAAVDAAHQVRRSVDLDVAWQEWQLAQRARLAVYRRVALAQQLALAAAVHKRQADDLATVKRAADDGLVTALDLAAATAAAHDAEVTVLDLRRQAADAKLALNRLMGLPPDADVVIEADTALPTHVDLPDRASLLAGLEGRRLDLLALRRGYASQEATVRAAILRRFPPLNVGVNVARDTGDLWTAGVGVGIALPIFDGNRGEVAIARATRRQLYDAYVARVFEARADVAALARRIQAIEAQLAAAQAAIPPQQRLVDGYRAAVQGGQADVLSYYQAWRDLTRLKRDVVDLESQLVEARVGLELATGRYDLAPDAPTTTETPVAPPAPKEDTP